jgi:4'-phosphopantetheinyl transferase
MSQRRDRPLAGSGVSMPASCKILVKIWPLVVSDERLNALRAHLSLDEQARLSSMRVASIARSFVIARGMARELLALECQRRPVEIAFAAGPRGKPQIAQLADAPSFNLSHSAGFCALAVSAGRPLPNHRLGVDIEEIRAVERDIARAYFTRREADWLQAVDDDVRHRAFTKCWVLKEAYLKATGDGLAGGLDALELALEAGSAIEPVGLRGRALGQSGADLSQWRFASFDVSSTIVGSVAAMTNGSPLDIEIANLDPEQPAGEQSLVV